MNDTIMEYVAKKNAVKNEEKKRCNSSKKYRLTAMIMHRVDAEIGGKNQEEAINEFIHRIKTGNYDRQLLRNYLDDNKRDVFISIETGWS